MGIKLIAIPLIVGILIIPIINSSGAVKGVTHEDNIINLTKNDKIFPINHRVAVSESNVFVVWADIAAPALNNSNYDNQDIFFTKSTDTGSSFGKIINLSNNSGNSNIPQISAVGANVYVVWLDDFSGNQDIFFKKSTDGGNSFGKIIDLSRNNNENTDNNTHSSFNPQLAVSGNSVYVVWQEDDATTGNQDIFFKKSTDGGNSFGPVNNLSRTDGDSLAPQIALSSGIERGGEGGNNSTNIYLVWTDCVPKIVSDEPLCDILFTKSKDNGNSFDGIINLSNNTGASFDPQISMSTDEGEGGSKSSNTLYVTWQDDSFTSSGNYDIFFTKSTDGGNSFESTENLSKTNGTSRFQKMATPSQSNVFLTWADVNDANNLPSQTFDILFKKSTDGGNSFGKIIDLSRNNNENTDNNTHSSFNPQLAVSGNNVYVVWQEDDAITGNQDIFFKKS
ncbi:MAG: sialidase family protein, partial [Nitrososphaeraceae archaeon]